MPIFIFSIVSPAKDRTENEYPPYSFLSVKWGATTASKKERLVASELWRPEFGRRHQITVDLKNIILNFPADWFSVLL